MYQKDVNKIEVEDNRLCFELKMYIFAHQQLLENISEISQLCLIKGILAI